MNSSNRFSVLVPVYNVEKYISRCIESVLEQTYQNFEIVLVDDGSTDNSGNICKEFVQKDSRIKLVRQNNSGPLFSRCTAIRNATGNYYVFLDSDDYLEPNALEVLQSSFEKYRCDCVVYNFKYYFENKGFFQEQINRLHRQTPFLTQDKKEIISLFFTAKINFNSLSRKAIKADIVSANTDYSKYYHIRNGEDALHTLEIYRNLKSVLFLDNCLYVYRQHSSSLCHRFTIDLFESELTVLNAQYYFLQREICNLFTSDELLTLKKRLVLDFIYLIKIVSRGKNKYAEKKQVLEQMFRSEYFSKANLEYDQQKKRDSIANRLVMRLFRHRVYWGLIAVEKSKYSTENFVTAVLPKSWIVFVKNLFAELTTIKK